MRGPEPLELSHRDLVVSYLRRYPPEVSEHTFTNLYVWRGSHPVRVWETQDSLVFLGRTGRGLVMVGPPVGPLPLGEAARLVEEQCPDEPLVALERLPKGALEGLGAERPEATPDRDNSDYVYKRSDLAELAGRRLHAKRNLVERCLSEHQCAYEAVTPALLPEIADAQRRWCAQRDCGNDPGLCAESRAVAELVSQCEALGVIGGAVRVDGRIEAFAFGERLNDRTAVVHFEKAMGGIEGLYQVINQWFCRNALSAFEYVNREQDLGIPGLRKAKQSYHPDHMVEKHVVSLRPAALAEPARGRCRE